MKQINKKEPGRDQASRNDQPGNAGQQQAHEDTSPTDLPNIESMQEKESYTLEGGKKNSEGNNSTQGIP
jgi:hypothetical protein